MNTTKFLKQSVGVVKDFLAERLQKLVAGSRIAAFAANESVVHHGAEAAHFGVVRSGTVSPSVGGNGGARQPLGLLKTGEIISLNDGYLQLEVTEIKRNEVACEVRTGGELRSRKGLNLPGIDLGISAFTERDRECLKFALQQGVDAVSQSFVESAADLKAVREAARELGHAPFLIAKIERSRALERLDEILEAADGVMIARGDLGVEVPIERIALVQRILFAGPTSAANQSSPRPRCWSR